MFNGSFDESYISNPNFDFQAINRNLFDEFDDVDCTVISQSELMPVYLRIRPLSANESTKKILIPVNCKTVVLKPANENKSLRAVPVAFGQASHEFVFSRVFDELATQNDVFRAALLDRVSEFLEGVNGLIFAYGTTSSGKTYTLQGTPNNAGIVPRALECIFRSATLLKQPSTDDVPDGNSKFLFAPYGFNELEELSVDEADKRCKEKTNILRFDRGHGSGLSASSSLETNRDESRSTIEGESSRLSSDDTCMTVPFAFKESAAFAFWISFVEIYNEVVYDLLDPEFVAATLKSSNRTFKPRKNPLDLRTDKKGHVFVKGVRWYPVHSAAEATALLRVGRRCQAVSATRLNTASSRSHAIFSLRALRISSRGKADIDFRTASLGSCSELVFCDLAGSERCLKADTTNNSYRLRETNSINTSLFALGKCIAALHALGRRDRQGAHSASYPVVPYRESRLTRLFSNFFSPQGLGISNRVCLLVNAAPCVELVDETLHALKFSALASQVILPQLEAPAPPVPIPEVAKEVEESSDDSSRLLSERDPDTTIEPGIDSRAAATVSIEKQLRAHLLKKGFQLRCSNSLIGGKTRGSALADISSPMSALPIAVSPIFGPPPTSNGSDCNIEEEPATLVRKPAADGGRVGSLAHFEWMEDIESDLAGLSREALISVVLEVVSALADTLPAEVEAAKAEVNERLTKNYGDELLRMEEQYESLLEKQQRDYEEKLRVLESRQYRQRRRTIAQEQLSPSSRKPMAKTRRIEEEAYVTDTEEVDANVDDDECPSCLKLAAEVTELRSKLDEAKADLAEQSEAMVSLSEQRDALQVDLRRAQFYAQMAKAKLVMNSQTDVFPPLIETGSGSGTPQTAVKRLSSLLPNTLPPFLSPAHRSSDPDIIPPTPNTVIPAERRKFVAVNANDLRAENQQLLSQLARLRVDFDNSKCVSQQDEDKEAVIVKKEMTEDPEPMRTESRSTAVRMDSFVSHELEAEKQEALAEMESRCSLLNAELSQVRSEHKEALAKLEEVKNRLVVYEQLKKRFEEAETHQNQSEAQVQTEDHYESSVTDARSSMESARQDPQLNRAQRGRGRRTKASVVTKKATSRGARGRGRNRTVSELPVETPDNVLQFEGSDEENEWSERLARDITNIQISGSVSGSSTATGTDLQFVATEKEEPKGARRRARVITTKKRATVANESDGAPGENSSPSSGFRKLAPLSETIQFLDIGGSVQPTPRPRRNLRPRK